MAEKEYPPPYPPSQPEQPYPPSQPEHAYPPPPQPYPPSQPEQVYPPPPQSGTAVVTTVVVTEPVVITQPVFKDFPVTITDSKGQQVQTIVEYRVGLLTWIIIGVICFITLFTGCCCIAIIPCFIDQLKDVYHISPTDNTVVGVYKRI